eukprot:1509209-Pyramimonas_sp.AAC.1
MDSWPMLHLSRSPLLFVVGLSWCAYCVFLWALDFTGAFAVLPTKLLKCRGNRSCDGSLFRARLQSSELLGDARST